MDNKHKHDIMYEMIARLIEDPKHRASLAGLFAPMRLLRIRHNGDPKADVPDVMKIPAEDHVAHLVALVRIGLDVTFAKEHGHYYTPDEWAAIQVERIKKHLQ